MVRARIFRSNIKPWETMIEEASQFASLIGPAGLINISMSASGGTTLLGGGGVLPPSVVVSL